MDYIDTDNLVKHLINTLSVPAKAVRSQSEVSEIREQRQAQQEQQAQLDQAQQVAESAGAAAPMLKATQ